jgi:hypothetical protein
VITSFYNTLSREGFTIARKTAVVQKQPTIKPERALRALTEQLEALQKLRGRHSQEADAEETEWMHLSNRLLQRKSPAKHDAFPMLQNLGLLQLPFLT